MSPSISMNRTETYSETPETERPTAAQVVARVLPRLVILGLLAIVTTPLWPLYWLGTLIWYRPPNTPRLAQVVRYLKLTWTVRPPPPGLSPFARFWITLQIIQKVLLTPI